MIKFILFLKRTKILQEIDEMKYVLILLLSMVLPTLGTASEDSPTKEEVAKLYVATFNRAPDSAGLNYWINDSGLKLSQIAQSFFEQGETQTLYPASTTNRNFIASVYQNLFNRNPDSAGWDYWEEQLTLKVVSKSRFIEAIINGALGSDVTILSNKTEVGIAFADKGLNDTTKAKQLISTITDDSSTVTTALEFIAGDNVRLTPVLSEANIKSYLDAINQARTQQQNCGSKGVFPATHKLTWNDKLYKAAYQHSNDLAQSNTFSHSGSGTASDLTGVSLGKASSMVERIEDYGYLWSRLGENIAAGTNTDTPEKVIQQWLDSDGHCANLMSSNFTEIGMAMVKNTSATYTHYWTQNFGTPR